MFKRSAILILLTIIFCGCGYLSILVDNTARNFSEPKKIKNKITEPIKDNVRLLALWVGHSTVLLQIDDKVILTDPFLTNNAAEVLRRVVEPGLDLNDLDKCDMVLISHSHMDHMNLGSLKMVSERFPGTNLVFPEGVEEFLPDYNFKLTKLSNSERFTKSILGQTKTVDGVKLTSVFAMHWAGRYGVDGYLWGDPSFTGFIIEYNGITVYFAGDTGYDENAFKEIGTSYKIDLALIPIGPCRDCEGIGTRNHVNPQGALRIFQDVKAEHMIPIHYGTLTFLADPDLPKYTLEKQIENSVYKEKIKILEPGGQYIFINKE